MGFAGIVGDYRNWRDRIVQPDGPEAHGRIRHRGGDWHGGNHAGDRRRRPATGELAHAAAAHRTSESPAGGDVGGVRVDRAGAVGSGGDCQPDRRDEKARVRHRQKINLDSRHGSRRVQHCAGAGDAGDLSAGSRQTLQRHAGVSERAVPGALG